jgi:hypothetical protein
MSHAWSNAVGQNTRDRGCIIFRSLSRITLWTADASQKVPVIDRASDAIEEGSNLCSGGVEFGKWLLLAFPVKGNIVDEMDGGRNRATVKEVSGVIGIIFVGNDPIIFNGRSSDVVSMGQLFSDATTAVSRESLGPVEGLSWVHDREVAVVVEKVKEVSKGIVRWAGRA